MIYEGCFTTVLSILFSVAKTYSFLLLTVERKVSRLLLVNKKIAAL